MKRTKEALLKILAWFILVAGGMMLAFIVIVLVETAWREVLAALGSLAFLASVVWAYLYLFGD